ncbi:MAG: NAD(P)H-dependent oxidoreductase, partial [Actinobacteria bacterium]|nr:NAD(P)H-dependent oxidoreductase [Actinomycetota bacterium]
QGGPQIDIPELVNYHPLKTVTDCENFVTRLHAVPAYIDQIIMFGTLDVSVNRGLAGKKVTFIMAHGGSYAPSTPKASWDFETGYLKLVASALGATDVQIIAADFTLAGVSPAMADFVDAKAASISAARQAARSRAA